MYKNEKHEKNQAVIFKYLFHIELHIFGPHFRSHKKSYLPTFQGFISSVLTFEAKDIKYNSYIFG